MGANDNKTLQPNVAEIITQWGWQVPTKNIVDLAVTAARLKECKSGEAVVELGVLSEKRLRELQEQKPEGVRTLEWIAQVDPTVRGQIEKILALSSGYAFYESLEGLSPHPAMQDAAVLAKCDDLDAALMLIEEHNAVLVFSAYNDMLRYAVAGMEERLNDALRRKLGDQLLVAVGKRDQVLASLSAAKGKDVQGASNIVAMWYGANATDKHEKMMARILDYALSNQVTDVAISPERGSGSVVEMRRKRDMVACPITERLTPDEAEKIVDFLLAKSGANPTLSKVREPRDGNIIYRSNSGDAELRLSFIPINQPGEYLISVSIRLMARTQATVELASLNIDHKVRAQLSAAAKLAKGFVLIVGGTNTGKSTTIAGALEENYRHFGRSRKRISLEKPVERLLTGRVTQVNIPASLENAFDTYLESIKRHDPDVINVGEILGPATANAAVTAAISGHLVFSTFHGNDTLLGYAGVSQMLDQNKRYQFIEALTMIVAQDMVREVCPQCGLMHEPTDEERELFAAYCTFKGVDAKLPSQTMHINVTKGPDQARCVSCNGDGVINVLPINEVLLVTAPVKDAMFAMLSGQVIGPNGENYREQIAKARSGTLFDAAMKLVIEGKTELGDAIQ